MEDLGSKEGTGSFIHATVLPGFDSRLAISFSWSKGISSALVAREKKRH